MNVSVIYHITGYSFLRNGQPVMLGFDCASGVNADNADYYALIDENNFIITAIPV
jgi:hypothetical protein